MLYCNRCGQCGYISDDNFVQIHYVHGTQIRYLDNESGDVVDYGDEELESDDNGDDFTECPHCNSNNIDFDWEGSEEEAGEQRKAYRAIQEQDRKNREAEMLKKTIKQSDWDLETNAVHK